MGELEKPDLRISPFDLLGESVRWEPLLTAAGLNEAMADRLLRILLVHLMLDRFITSILTLHLVAKAAKSANLESVELLIADMSIAQRADMCVALGIATDAWKSDFSALNKVRNKLSHYKPKSGLDKVKELSSPSAFEACIRQGFRAMSLAGKKAS
jgi:hypothetical protein